MSAITRYILTEFAKTFVLTLGALTAVLMLTCVSFELERSEVPLEYMYLFAPWLVPYAVKSAIPAAALFATSTVFGRMAAFNELTAAKAMGIAPSRLLLPLLAVVAPLCALLPLLDDLHSDQCVNGMHAALREHAVSILQETLRRGETLERKGFSIHAERCDGDQLRNIYLQVRNTESKTTTLSAKAESGVFRKVDDSPTLKLVLSNGEMLQSEMRMQFVGDMEFDLPINGRVSRAFTRSRVLEAQARVDAAESAYQKIGFQPVDSPERRHAYQVCQAARDSLRKCEVQFMHKWASGFACLGFILVAAPTAVLMRSSNYLASFFVCFLPIILVYQPLQKLPIIYAEAGSVPSWFVWSGNVLLACVGGRLMCWADAR